MAKGDGNRGKGMGISWIRAHLNYEGPECLPWPFCRDDKGYGQCGYNGGLYKASRLMCILKHGEPPSPEHHAAHSCGNGHKGCTHPLHLSWKTPAGNSEDTKAHGNARKDKGRKLTHPQIKAILALKGLKTTKDIADFFDIHQRTVSRIHNNISWRDGVPHKTGSGGIHHALIGSQPL